MAERKDRKILRGAAAGSAAAVFILYVITLAPGVGFIDAGELSTVAHTFGVAHPTGYPLFTLLAGLWSFLPLGDGIYRLNLLAAVWTALSVGVLVLFYHDLLEAWLVRRLQKTSSPKKGPKGKTPDKRSSVPPPAPRLLAAVSVFGALVSALTRTYWASALAIEVYSLHLLLLSLALWAFSRIVFTSEIDDPVLRKRTMLFALLLGLGFSNHMTTILLLPAVFTLWFMRFGRSGWMRGIKALPAFFAGLLPYLYLPLRAAAAPILNWGNPAGLEQLFWHVSGRQYRVWMFSSSEVFREKFTAYLAGFPAEFGYLAALLVIAGVLFSFSRNRRVAWFLLLLFLTCILYASNYDIHDIDSYYLLATVVAGSWAAMGMLRATERGGAFSLRNAVAAGAVVVGVMIGVQYSEVSQRGNYLVDDYTHNMLSSFKENALVVSMQWDFWVSASYYYQIVEGHRPDVVVLDKELFRRSWYLDQLRRNHPEIYRRSQPEIEAFRKELYKFEHDLPYDPQTIENAFNRMVNSFFEKNYRDRPVYATLEIEKQFGQGFVRVPEGLAFRLYRPGDAPLPGAPVWDDFEYRPFDGGGDLALKMRSFYASMLLNRGVLLHGSGDYFRAERYFDRALQFVPGDPTVLQWKQRNAQAQGMS